MVKIEMPRKENWKEGRLLHVGLSCLFFLPLCSVLPLPFKEKKLEIWEGLDSRNLEIAEGANREEQEHA